MKRQKHGVAERGAPNEREVTVVLHVDTDAVLAQGVSGRMETSEGVTPFHGWLDLLGKLEAVVDRAKERVRRG